ncbi:hypothetical protein GCM10010531_03480 [Blastococcus jejuensis]|uniref:Excreted virulence factor EspC, type VII ESX diderm n=1 Tax=Blastococcus jejuensis TaxID=351224 RepID=A0ABP6NQ49_9ACTN
MTIEMPADEVYALAAVLRAEAETAQEAAARLPRDAAGAGPDLEGALEEFLDCHRVGAGALAGELRRLGGTVAAVADSWLGLDEVLLAARGRAPR